MARHALTSVAVLAALAFAAVLPLASHAHGIGTPQRLNVPSGPYLLSMWTDPDPLRADESHVVVAVLDPATREPIVTGVEVIVRMVSLDDGMVVSLPAQTDSTNRLFYAAEFNDRVTPGQWQVVVSAAGDRGTSDEVTFEVAIEPARGFNWLWAGAAGLAAVLGLWLLSAMRSTGTRRDRQSPLPPTRR